MPTPHVRPEEVFLDEEIEFPECLARRRLNYKTNARPSLQSFKLRVVCPESIAPEPALDQARAVSDELLVATAVGLRVDASGTMWMCTWPALRVLV